MSNVVNNNVSVNARKALKKVVIKNIFYNNPIQIKKKKNKKKYLVIGRKKKLLNTTLDNEEVIKRVKKAISTYAFKTAKNPTAAEASSSIGAGDLFKILNKLEHGIFHNSERNVDQRSPEDKATAKKVEEPKVIDSDKTLPGDTEEHLEKTNKAIAELRKETPRAKGEAETPAKGKGKQRDLSKLPESIRRLQIFSGNTHDKRFEESYINEMTDLSDIQRMALIGVLNAFDKTPASKKEIKLDAIVDIANNNQDVIKHFAGEPSHSSNSDDEPAQPQQEPQEGTGDNPGLTNIQIEKLMKKDPSFKGVFAPNTLKNLVIPKEPQRFSFIINTAPFPEPGHWTSVVVDPNRAIEFFNSFGTDISPMVLKELKHLLKGTKWNKEPYQLKVNLVQVQSKRSNNCGYFAMKFLTDRARNESFNEATHFDLIEKARDDILNDSKRGEEEIRQFKEEIAKYPEFPFIRLRKCASRARQAQ